MKTRYKKIVKYPEDETAAILIGFGVWAFCLWIVSTVYSLTLHHTKVGFLVLFSPLLLVIVHGLVRLCQKET